MTTATATIARKNFKFEEDNTVIYPKTKDGRSMRVVIIRRKLTSEGGAVFHVCLNAGKWSYRIDYPFKPQTTRMTRAKFIAELRRMGGLHEAGRMVAQWHG
jgi:hypothetical protein